MLVEVELSQSSKSSCKKTTQNKGEQVSEANFQTKR